MILRQRLCRAFFAALLVLTAVSPTWATQYNAQQKANITTDGNFYAGTYNFAQGVWGNTLSGNASTSLLYMLPADQWMGIYLYDYPTAAWQEALYAWRTATVARVPAMVDVAAGTFTMGRRDDGDDGTYGADDELPRHSVTLSPYRIGAFEVTNGQYADMLNWALAQGRLENESGGAYATGDVYDNGEILIEIEDEDCEIAFDGAAFYVLSRDGESLVDHPAIEVSWYGAVAYCNWLSEHESLPVAYDLATWELLDGNPSTAQLEPTTGYRLPTEAEWERAAAWDAATDTHFIYAVTSDTLLANQSSAVSTKARANYYDANPDYVNPVPMATMPYTSPVGWFNGVNINPNGWAPTVDSPSPVGCYDMTGNLFEWCHDWYDAYTSDAQTNPLGAASGTHRILRGGSWGDEKQWCRTAFRYGNPPEITYYHIGFRVARSTP